MWVKPPASLGTAKERVKGCLRGPSSSALLRFCYSVLFRFWKQESLVVCALGREKAETAIWGYFCFISSLIVEWLKQWDCSLDVATLPTFNVGAGDWIGTCVLILVRHVFH